MLPENYFLEKGGKACAPRAEASCQNYSQYVCRVVLQTKIDNTPPKCSGLLCHYHKSAHTPSQQL